MWLEEDVLRTGNGVSQVLREESSKMNWSVGEQYILAGRFEWELGHHSNDLEFQTNRHSLYPVGNLELVEFFEQVS